MIADLMAVNVSLRTSNLVARRISASRRGLLLDCRCLA
jgi:hypothetical protein